MEDVFTSKLHRVKNMRHKKYARKQYCLLAEQDSTYNEDAVNRFNYKKTTANKYKFSCGGYGGTCGMCKRVYGDGKTQRKQKILYGEK